MLSAVLSIGTIGLVFGAGLAYASQKFAVEVDPRVEAIMDALPGANCGACGYPGCAGFAEAVVANRAPVDGCPPGGGTTAAKVGEIMGVEVIASGDKRVAICLCKGGCEEAVERYNYDGISDCRVKQLLSGGSKACSYGCLGDGTCAVKCPFDAITMNENRLPVVDPDKCTACGVCAEVCPRNLFIMSSVENGFHVLCRNKEKGAVVRKECTVGCIACMRCEKNCPFDAIHVKDNLARIDYEKCMNCSVCERVCPNDTIVDLRKNKFDYARVNKDKCSGCGICVSLCPVNVITLKHGRAEINEDDCIACGLCVRQCPEEAIDALHRTAEEKAELAERIRQRKEAEKERKRKAAEAKKKAAQAKAAKGNDDTAGRKNAKVEKEARGQAEETAKRAKGSSEGDTAEKQDQQPKIAE